MSFEMALQVYLVIFLTGLVILLAKGLHFNMSKRKTK